MQKVNCTRDKWRNVAFFLTAGLIVVVDQLSKAWIRTYPEGQSLFEIGFFRLTHIYNTGAAFGLFKGHSFTLTIVASVGIALLLLYVLFLYRKFPLLDNRLGRPAFGLVLGGTVGNLIDRLNPGLEGVTDFISIGFWPAFNIADSAIVVGIITIAYSLLFLAPARKS